jgi:cytochrome P450
MSEESFPALQARIGKDEPVIRFADGDLGIFDPVLVSRVEADNFRDAPVPGGVARAGSATWAEVREPLIRVASRQNAPAHLIPLQARMREFLRAEGGEVQNLTLLIEKAVSHALVPLVVDGLDERHRRLIIRDQATKLTNLVTPSSVRFTRRKHIADAWHQIMAGHAVRAHLRARRSGRIPPQEDSAQAVLDLGDRLTPGQAAYVVMTLLTAVSGAPGSVAACLLFELCRRPEWRERLSEELGCVSDAALCASPARAAPLTFRFAREVLRLWSFPMMSHRRARSRIEVGGHALDEDRHYHLSSYLTHRNPRYWPDADAFDPDRWAGGSPTSEPGAYVPFGWGRRNCVGASLGFSQLMLFARLAVAEFDVQVEDIGAARMRLEGAALPDNFVGRVVPR